MHLNLYNQHIFHHKGLFFLTLDASFAFILEKQKHTCEQFQKYKKKKLILHQDNVLPFNPNENEMNTCEVNQKTSTRQLWPSWKIAEKK